MISQSTTRIVLPIDMSMDKYNISSIKSRIQSPFTTIDQSSYAPSITSSTCPPPFEAPFIDGFKPNTNIFNTFYPSEPSPSRSPQIQLRDGAITKRKYDNTFFSNNKSREEKQITNGSPFIEYENKNDIEIKRG
eukprot:130320_1